MDTDTTAIICVLVSIAIDCIYGTIGSMVTHSFDSSKMRAGLMHKSAEIVIVGVAYLIQWVTANGVDLSQIGITGEIPTGIAVSAYVIVMEVGSILELCVKYNPQLSNNRLLHIFSHEKDGGSNE